MALIDKVQNHWTLNESSGTRADSHGARDLTDNNTVGSNTGKLDDCADFNAAASESLSHADHADFDGGDRDLTFTGWFNSDSWAVSSSFPMIFAKTESGSPFVEYELFYGTGNIIWRVNSVGSINVTRTAPSTGVWTFFECGYDATAEEIFLRLNNGTAATIACAGGIRVGSGVFRLGARGSLNTLFFDGKIDSFTIFDALLTTDERAALYNSGNGLDYPFSGGATLPALDQGMLTGGLANLCGGLI